MDAPGTVFFSMMVGGAVAGFIAALIFFMLGYIFAGKIRAWLIKLKWQRLRKKQRGREHHDS
jgi:predicted PurR-regulated permease PerM